jgi:Na+-translocating ferredoxin:NAD+ oxidoreductase RnfD subunit
MNFAIPQVTGISSTWETVAGAVLVVGIALFWHRVPKWLAVIVTILATAAVISTPHFGAWMQGYLHGVTNGFLGRS